MSDPSRGAPPPSVLAGVALLSGALLVIELTSTRLLSVVMAYHFAVLSISLAMLGLAAGGVAVYLRRAQLARHGAPGAAATLAFVFSALAAVALLALLGLPVQPVPTLAGVMNLALLFVPQALPYLAGGAALAAILAAYPGSVGRVYLADLGGASLGCLVTAVALPHLGGGGTILLAALLGAGAGWAFSVTAPVARPLRRWAWTGVLALGLPAGVAFKTFEPSYIKGTPETPGTRVVWTSHSRIGISPPMALSHPFGWGFGARFVPDRPPYHSIRLHIDGMAETPVTRWDGDRESISFLQWDVTAVPYLLRDRGKALVIGAGGGRDILSAHLSGGWSVDAVEIDEGIAGAMTHELAAFSGSVYELPQVSVQVLDGRSAIERAPPGTYDLVQMSAVDTWASGARDAFALAENSLYTVEAFRAVVRCLRPDGLLAVSRFKYPDDQWGETVRLVAVAAEALEEIAPGRDPAPHMLLLTNLPMPEYRLATLLVKPTPFSPGEIAQASRICVERGFGLVWPAVDGSIVRNPAQTLLRAQGRAAREAYYASYPIDIRPTRDDRPYFLQQTRLASAVAGQVSHGAALRLVPVLTLLRLALFLVVACAGLVVYPMVASPGGRPGTGTELAYFTLLGLAFMLYEIPVVQRLTVGLGHPTFALTVALFGLLLGTAAGSALAGAVATRLGASGPLLGGLVAAGTGVALVAALPGVTRLLFTLPGLARIGFAAAVVLAVGVPLGTMFPLGIRALVRGGREEATAWCWAANGAASVLASVLALLLAIEAGASRALLLGAACYLGAALTGLRMARTRHSGGAATEVGASGG